MARLEVNATAISPGIGVGVAVPVLAVSARTSTPRRLAPHEVPEALEQFEAARKRAIQELGRIQEATARELGLQDAAIYAAQAAVLQDPDALRKIRTLVGEQGQAPESAILQLLDEFGSMFEGLEGGDVRNWAADLRDPWQAVMRELGHGQEEVVRAGGEPAVLFAEELTPTLVARFPRDRVAGVVCARGGRFSHGAVVARSFGIPVVAGVEGLSEKFQSGESVVVYGGSGRLLLGADTGEQERARQRASEHARVRAGLRRQALEAGRTADGTPVQVMANIESPRDLETFDPGTVAGVGLFRTEFAYMERPSFPSAEEQRELYAGVLERFPGKPVVFRTLDVGNDKQLRYLQLPEEDNPAMGWRGLRLSLEWQDLFLMQLQAIRDSRGAGGRPSVLLPMVTTVEELRRVREILATLSDDGDFGVPLGAMIEVPAAAIVLRDLLGEVDFVSVGTNDLAQYLFAVDRDNPWVADLYQPYHPAHLRVLDMIAHACAEAGKPVSVCGEMASQHAGAVFLAGVGLRSLSMAPAFVPEIKALLRSLDAERMQEAARAALSASTAQEAFAVLDEVAREGWSRAVRQLENGDEAGGA